MDWSKLVGRYFLSFLLITIVCYLKNWDKVFEVAIVTFFAGGVANAVWGNKDESGNIDKTV